MSNAFIEAVKNQPKYVQARTDNGMKARKTSSNPCVDLFYKIGASRGKNIIADFESAFLDNPEIALRIVLWARDIRGGAGERKIFRDIVAWLDQNYPVAALALVSKAPLVGRWDDVLLDFQNNEVKVHSFAMIANALDKQNGLAAKWLPRKGKKAAEIRNALGLTPKSYRKMLVRLTKVVESQMCAKEWDEINFSHVPSVASSRYKKAFGRHTEKYAEYLAKLTKGDKSVKVNASAIYPYQVLKPLVSPWSYPTQNEIDHVRAQWNALPNYVGDASILPLVDVSGSMTGGIDKNVTPIEVSVSLGLYLADKNKGAFKDTFLTFSGSSELVHLTGDIVNKVRQIKSSSWGMNTNLHAAFENILDLAIRNRVPQKDMPKILLILSDMQFDACVRYDDSAIQMIRRKYEKDGYTVPKIVFWNLNARDNSPVHFKEDGTALVSGFSPAIMKSILSDKLEKFTPENVMMETVMNPKYELEINI